MKHLLHCETNAYLGFSITLLKKSNGPENVILSAAKNLTFPNT